ncbi:DUF4384 domain-containing protein (plasmid) [Deinococcus taeanensis]|uniref:DUF4384 domain-containing protein n=1 Tax=Deinococcus taeanensis TaxID=2737050 RepID=UPI001CDB9BD4|nr:DUF4384 domain-containing protein [Deinococcus taeanensis]UBV44496.1 DUF4384 domain-containing protein [Deinococcus taeanensis]
MKSFTAHVSLVALLAIGSAAQAQVSAQSIIVNPVPTSLKVNVRTNRTTTAQVVPTFAPGDHLEFYTRVNQDAYVYLFNVDAQGHVALLASNGLQAAGTFVKANTTQVFPKKGKASTFLLTLPQGVNQVFALASLMPLNLGALTARTAAQGDMTPVDVAGRPGLAQALKRVLDPLKAQSWTTDTSSYAVTRSSLTGLPAVDVNALKAQVSFQRKARLSEVYVTYADRLRAEGYLVTDARYGEREAKGVFVRKGAQLRQLTLEVTQRGTTFFVKLTRQK